MHPSQVTASSFHWGGLFFYSRLCFLAFVNALHKINVYSGHTAFCIANMSLIVPPFLRKFPFKYCTGGFHGSDNQYKNMQVRCRRICLIPLWGRSMSMCCFTLTPFPEELTVALSPFFDNGRPSLSAMDLDLKPGLKFNPFQMLKSTISCVVRTWLLLLRHERLWDEDWYQMH